MKELYLCIFRQFNITLNEINFFDYNQKDETVRDKLQKAFAYYKKQSKNENIMFMQFCKNLQKVGKEYLTKRGSIAYAPMQLPQKKTFIFICLYDIQLMTVKLGTQQNFVYADGYSVYDAVQEFSRKMRNDFGVVINKDKCHFYTECCLFNNLANGYRTFPICFYSLKQEDYECLERKSRSVQFTHAFDPILTIDPAYVNVFIFMDIVKKYVRSVKKLMTRKKSGSLPVRLTEKTIKAVVEEEKKSYLDDRLKQFEDKLDGILAKYDLSFD